MRTTTQLHICPCGSRWHSAEHISRVVNEKKNYIFLKAISEEMDSSYCGVLTTNSVGQSMY